ESGVFVTPPAGLTGAAGGWAPVTDGGSVRGGGGPGGCCPRPTAATGIRTAKPRTRRARRRMTEPPCPGPGLDRRGMLHPAAAATQSEVGATPEARLTRNRASDGKESWRTRSASDGVACDHPRAGAWGSPDPSARRGLLGGLRLFGRRLLAGPQDGVDPQPPVGLGVALEPAVVLAAAELLDHRLLGRQVHHLGEHPGALDQRLTDERVR